MLATSLFLNPSLSSVAINFSAKMGIGNTIA
jgi:hypothetical protein